MSISPIGKIKNQINQGPLKNQSIFDNSMDKIAITGLSDLEQSARPDMDGLQDAMNSGGLDYEGQANQLDQTGMGEMPPGSSIAPNGPDVNRNRGISPFLQGDGELNEEESQMNQALLMERQKIQQALGGSGFQIDLSNNGKGAIKLVLTPQQGFQLTPEHWEQLLKRLSQTGINPTSITDPDASGRTTVVYNNNQGPQKVTKK